MHGFGQRAKFPTQSEDSVFEMGHLLFTNYINTPSGRFKLLLFITDFLQENSLAAVPFFIFFLLEMKRMVFILVRSGVKL